MLGRRTTAVGIGAYCIAVLRAQGAALAESDLPVVSLGETIRHRRAFSSVVGIRELSDGRIVVADQRERSVVLPDFRRMSAVDVGRLGEGPGEFGFPATVFPMRGDSTAVFDALNQALILVLPSGRTEHLASLAAQPVGAGGMRAVTPDAAGSLGRFHERGTGLRLAASGTSGQAVSETGQSM